MAILDEFDIPAAPVNDFAGVFSDPQIEAREMVKTYAHPTRRRRSLPAQPDEVQ